MPLLTNLGATAASSGLSFEHLAGSFAIDMIITAMESKGVGKLLSAPKVVTQNNSEGLVQQGTQIPIQTNINNTISTQYIAAVLMLKVTPQITADGTIFMIVHIENTQIDSGIPAILGQPALSTQSVDDQVLAKDGETVMLGWSDGQFADYPVQRSTSDREHPGHRKPLQAPHHQRAIAGTLVLPDASRLAGLARQNNLVQNVEREETMSPPFVLWFDTNFMPKNTAII